jgi:SNF2 family DNA or RNA helicase
MRAEVSTNFPNAIELDSSFADRLLIKTIPGSRWKAEIKRWTIPLSWVSCKCLRTTFKTALEIGPVLNQWGWDTLNNRVKPAMLTRDLLELPDEFPLNPRALDTIKSWRTGDPKLQLRGFQEVDVLNQYAAGSDLLAQPMGAGKTISAINTIRLRMELGDPQALPVLVVCPNSVKRAWAREFAKWMPQLSVRVISGPVGKRRAMFEEPTDVTIINWESLRLHSSLATYGPHSRTEAEKTPKELNQKWGHVIADEAHRAKDPRSKQTRALWASSEDAAYRIPMTGTPIANHVGEMWSILRFVAPDEWTSKMQYLERWVESEFNMWGGLEVHGLQPAHKDEYYSVVDPRMRRLPKEVILPNLPPKLYIERLTEMSPKQTKAYNQMLITMLAELDNENLVTVTNPLTKTMRLMQFASAYGEMLTTTKTRRVTEDEVEHDVKRRAALAERPASELHELEIEYLGKPTLVLGATVEYQDTKLNLIDPSNKIDELMLILEELEGEKVTVFAQSKQLINLAAARLDKFNQAARKANESPFNYIRITGDESEQVRQANMDEFQSARTCHVALATMAAGGTGITLTASNVMVRLQRDWSAVNNSQAEDRIHRIGSEMHKEVRIIDLITPGTIEETQLDILAGKYGNLQEIVRDKATMRKLLAGKLKKVN